MSDDSPITDEDLNLYVTDDRPLTKVRARRVTEMIKLQVIGLWQLIRDAYVGRAWVALGYESWDAYCAAEFPTSRLRLPREERSEVVNSLREAGLSIRAIEAATGVSRKTVIKDINQVVEFPPPDSDPVAEEPPGGLHEDSPGQTDRVSDALAQARNKTPTLGKDGKTYQPKPRPQPEQAPHRKPITDEFGKAVHDLEKAANRVVRLTADDRFPRNRDELCTRNLGTLGKIVNQLVCDVEAALNGRGDAR